MEYTKVVQYGGNECVILPDGSTRRVVTYYGNSSRCKPKYTDGARDADRLVETDTCRVYIFDGDIDDWRLFGG